MHIGNSKLQRNYAVNNQILNVLCQEKDLRSMISPVAFCYTAGYSINKISILSCLSKLIAKMCKIPLYCALTLFVG